MRRNCPMKVLYLLTWTMKQGRRTFLATCLSREVYRRQRNDLDGVTPSREEQTTKDSSNLLPDRPKGKQQWVCPRHGHTVTPAWAGYHEGLGRPLGFSGTPSSAHDATDPHTCMFGQCWQSMLSESPWHLLWGESLNKRTHRLLMACECVLADSTPTLIQLLLLCIWAPSEVDVAEISWAPSSWTATGDRMTMVVSGFQRQPVCAFSKLACITKSCPLLLWKLNPVQAFSDFEAYVRRVTVGIYIQLIDRLYFRRF